MDLVPDDVLSEHLLSLLSFRDALRLRFSCRRFRQLLSDPLDPLLEVLSAGGGLRVVASRAVQGGFCDFVRFLVDERRFLDLNLGMALFAVLGYRDFVEYFVGMGATYLDLGMLYAMGGGQLDVVDFFKRKMSDGMMSQ